MSTEDLADWSDDFDESENPDDGPDDDDCDEVVPCPACGEEVHEETVRCPHCGAYVTHDTSVWAGRSWWWIALGLLGIVAVVLSLALG